MLVIGLDLGTQSLKAVVCDESLAIRGSHSMPITTEHPEPGRAEQDPRAWAAALGPAIAGALEAAGAKPEDIAAIAITGQLDGCVAVDDSLAHVHPALIWQDRRAKAQAMRVEPTRIFAITGQVADASHLAPKIAWLRERGYAGSRFHEPTSYLVARLCGEHVMDPPLASTTMLAELSSGAWSPRLLEAFDLVPELLPQIRPTCDVAGTLTADGARLTGLPVGTRVAVGTGDDFSNPLGAGVVAPGSIICAIGTAEVVGALTRSPVLDTIGTEPMVETHVYPQSGDAKTFFVENPGWLSGGAIRWATQMLGLPDDRALDVLAASAPPGANGVTFVPALAGAMTPVWRPDLRGSLHELTAAHDRSHVARAVLEGLAFACRDVADRLIAMKLPVAGVLLVGGGAKSRVWAQLRADVLGLPHRVAANPDTSPLGAAMIASVAAGIHTDLAAAARLVSAVTDEVVPNPEAAAPLAAAYRRYQLLVGHMATLGSRG
jgi:xylulokinase